MNIPLSLYIHFPWCVKKCPYCDFNSHTLKNALPEEEYIDALLLNLKQSIVYLQGREITSIFMGGGTPSLFSPTCISRLLKTIESMVPFHPKIEITLEANPGTVDQERFKGYFQAGINRISLGIQSFDDEKLKALGRIHSGSHAKKAIDAAFDAGFTNINIDLMHGLPKQTIEEGLDDLRQGLAFKTTHLSWYELTLEPNTFFWHHPPPLPTEDNIITLQNEGKHLLSQHGFSQYEVSAYSRGIPSRHNLNYWEFGDYLAIGAGSHGKVTTDEGIFRYHHFRSPKQYMDISQGFLQEKQLIPSDQLAFEFMLNALRLKEGVSLSSFTERTGLSLNDIAPLIQQAQEQGWMTKDAKRLCTTSKGFSFLNNVVSLFLAESESC